MTTIIPTRSAARSRLHSPETSNPIPIPQTRVLDRPAIRSSMRPARDPFIDGIRAVGTLLVLILHWLMVEAVWDGTSLKIGNALSHGSAWLITWLQPLPVLFFAAGAAAGFGNPRRISGLRFAARRARGMLVPVLSFVLIWAGLLTVLPMAGVPEHVVHQVARIAPQPMWFLGVLVVLLALTPQLIRADRRWGLLLPVFLGGGAALVDVLRFAAGVDLAVANLVLIWSVPFLLGLRYAGRRIAGEPEVSVRTNLLVAGAGMVATVVLIAVGPYPVSLIGMPGDPISNLAPPTLPVVTFAVAQIAAVMAIREPFGRLAARSALLRWVGARSMGLYLWHLTAMFLLCGLLIFAVGVALPVPWTASWWLTRPVIALAAGALLLGLLRLNRVVHPAVEKAVLVWK